MDVQELELLSLVEMHFTIQPFAMADLVYSTASRALLKFLMITARGLAGLTVVTAMVPAAIVVAMKNPNRMWINVFFIFL